VNGILDPASASPYYSTMVPKISAFHIACVFGLAASAGTARADGTQFTGTRPLGSGGAMRGFATGDAGPMLNPSGISLIRTYQVEGAYQYGKSQDSHDARISAVDSTSGLNLGGALYYAYHHERPDGGPGRASHLTGASLSFPFAEKVFVGGSVKYLRFDDSASERKTGLTFDAGLTIRPVAQVAVGAVGYNLRDLGTGFAPRGFGGGAAVLPVPALLLVFDAVVQKVEGADSAIYYMGGAEFSYAAAVAFRAGGGRDGITKNAYVTAGLSAISAEVGTIDIGFRQDVSGTAKTAVFGVSARLFVPSM